MFKIVYLVLVIAILFVTGLRIIFDYKKCGKKTIMIFAVALSCISFSYIPIESDDLYRHFLDLNYLKDFNIIDVISLDFLFVKNLLFYLVSLTGINGFLAFTSTFVTYYLIILVIINVSKKYNTSKIQYILLVLICLSVLPYTFVVSGVRFHMAVAIFVYACYREFIEKKNNILTNIIYILPIFLHYSAIVFIVFKILSNITNKNKFIFGITCLTLATYSYWKMSLLEFISSASLKVFIDKVEMYSEEFVYKSSWQMLLLVFYILVYVAVFFVSIILKENKKEKVKNELEKNEKTETIDISLKYLSGLFFSMSIGNIGSFYLSERFLVVSIILLIIYTLGFKITKNSIKYFYFAMFPVLIYVGFYIQYIRKLNGVFEIFKLN